MPVAKTLLVINSPQLRDLLKEHTLAPAGYSVTLLGEHDELQLVLKNQSFDIIFVEFDANLKFIPPVVDKFLSKDPCCAVILVSPTDDKDLLLGAFRAGAADVLTLPLEPDEVLTAVQRVLERRRTLQTWVLTQSDPKINALQHQINELEEMGNIARSVTSSLDLDRVLKVIVDTAVKLTGAEEGSLLILDEDSGELVMRAARNFQDDFVRMFRLPVQDTLAGDVIRKGLPVIINADTPQKIKTTYLVRTLMYVPLKVSGKVIGVLGVDNRENGETFSQQQLSLVSTLADYAAIAIENARLYRDTELERQKLDSILTQIEDGVIVIGADDRIVLINRKAQVMFDLLEEDVTGQPLAEVIHHEGLLDIFKQDHVEMPYRCEIALEEGYILDTHLVQIPDIGLAVTMQDITYFKELDRIKTDFVSTVSHDLRSPLTAILGYIELITRVGDVNEQQREFIRRVQTSARNISDLIASLLELGRIESGFDTLKEFVPFGVIVTYAIDSLKSQIDEYQHRLTVEISDDLPEIFGDPTRLRQVAENLLSNAVQYTPTGGEITVRVIAERDQIVFQVADTGLGIPLPDQPYVFDKFYRAGNIPDNASGSGLGLAIVKSIVETHQGRVWVDSTPGKGSKFTVVFPVTERPHP